MKYSPTDLTRHLACSHTTHLETLVESGALKRPLFKDPVMEVLRKRGFEHEAAYVEHIKAEGLRVSEPIELDEKVREAFKTSQHRLRDAMKSGVDVITQAHLVSGDWHGYADVLLKVEGKSQFGEYLYEPLDTKLSQKTKGATILQLCIYTLILEELQGSLPERLHVVSPGVSFVPESYRTADCSSYTAMAKRSLEEFSTNPVETYPYPCAHCQICDWWQLCENRRRDDDHLTLVAGLTTKQALDLESAGIGTLSILSNTKPLPILPNVSPGVLERLQAQAQVQLQGRELGQPYYELIDPSPNAGLVLLPSPSDGDVYLDFEAARLYEPDGLDYLLGFCFRDETGELEYKGYWAENPSQEKTSFEAFLAFLSERIEAYPDLHIYHFGGYETGAMKRLMLRHATGIDVVDGFLRSGRFVDLHKVTRQGVRASVEHYSLKDLEAFHGFEREQGMSESSKARHLFEAALDLRTVSDIPAEARKAIELYNKDDCLSTASLQKWLESLRSQLVEAEGSIERPLLGDSDPSERVQQFNEEVEAIISDLLRDVPELEEERDEEQQAMWLLANLIPYYRREEKVEWWEYFRLAELEEHEFLTERSTIGAMEFIKRVGGTDNCPTHRYRFAEQEVALKPGADLQDPSLKIEDKIQKVGTVVDVDLDGFTVDIKKTGKTADHHPERVFGTQMVSPAKLESSLLDFGRHVAVHGFENPGIWQTAVDLLLKNPPRLNTPKEGPLRLKGEETVAAAKRLCRDMTNTVFPIQGPPGTGKSYTSARVILDLVRAGKKIGICAVSHKVIEALLIKVVEAADGEGVPIACYQKPKGGVKDLPDGLALAKDNRAVAKLLSSNSPVVIGATAWTWAHEDFEGELDYLFVDEAGQISLAYALAIARSAENLVLVGDPQQLEQPQRGSHPEGCESAALVHLLDGKRTLPEDRGLFLDVTYRLHPSICEYTSNLFYEDRLEAHASCEVQSLAGVGHWNGAGIHWVDVNHSGNQSRSPEEVSEIVGIVKELTAQNATWVNEKGETKPITLNDILIVAPYNLQVSSIATALPGARVGTVDMFQGQEAAIVIYSMTSSSVEDAPRGMGFLYNPNRLNVATSRARCAVIVVGSPQVCHALCSTPEQIRRVNGVCRIAKSGLET